MADFTYSELLQLGEDKTKYKCISKDGVSVVKHGDMEFLKVDDEALRLMTEKAFFDVSHFLRSSHLEGLSNILKDPESSKNDCFVAGELLKNAVIAAQKVMPSCQDTGTAIIMGKKGQNVLTDGDDAEALSKGVYDVFQEDNLRYSQVAPLSMYEEKNTGNNLPAQIDIYSTKGMEYKFLMLAKGGGSANKTYLYQKTKALLNEDSMLEFISEKFKELGTAACPPYHLAFVVGGTSAEANLKTVKLASAGYLDGLPTEGDMTGRAFRDIKLEGQFLEITRKSGIGAQFGGKYFCHDVRVIRLPRHGASCPVGLGVSCSADRNIKGKITKDGVFIEQLEEHPEQYLPTAQYQVAEDSDVLTLDLNRPMAESLAKLKDKPVLTRVNLNGTIVVARDIAHAKLKERLDSGKGLPQYLKDFPVYYAGPAKTPDGMASGSFGPTTAQRMDPYVEPFQAEGATMIMLAKGNRTAQVREACKKYGGFYLGSIGGPAARLGRDCITKVEVLEYAELGMEAVWKIEVKDFPAFIIVNNKGEDFFAKM
ncbi:MAG: fumarate hydratase [Lentisphaeraceae bacterium]|nr:fumarate hydratase [Lentisphaeraceae bacterium]